MNSNLKESIYMKKLKIGTFLIVLGNLLYLASMLLGRNETSDFENFSSGLLLGLSIGCNLIGIIMTVSYMSKNDKEK